MLGQTRYIDDLVCPTCSTQIKRAGVAAARIAASTPGRPKHAGRDGRAHRPRHSGNTFGRRFRISRFSPTTACITPATASRRSPPSPSRSLPRRSRGSASTTSRCPPSSIRSRAAAGRQGPSARSNVYAARHPKGDVERVSPAPTASSKACFRTQMVEHVSIEPHAAIADWDANGRLTVWATLGRITLGARRHRADVEAADESRAPDRYHRRRQFRRQERDHPGAGAGAAREESRPAGQGRVHARRRIHSRPRRGILHHGLQDRREPEGRILRAQVRLVLDGGAYCSWSETTLGKASILAAGPYSIDNVLWRRSSSTPTRRWRAPCAASAPRRCASPTNRTWTTSRSRSASIRSTSGCSTRSRKAAQSRPGRCCTASVVKSRCARRPSASAGRSGATMKRRGRGIACMWYPIGFTVSANPSAAVVKVNEDGTATVLTGTVETGQGALDRARPDRRRGARHRGRRRPRRFRRHRHHADGYRRDRQPHHLRHGQRGPARRRGRQGRALRGGGAGAARAAEPAGGARPQDPGEGISRSAASPIGERTMAQLVRASRRSAAPVESRRPCPGSGHRAGQALQSLMCMPRRSPRWKSTTRPARVDVMRIVAAHDCGRRSTRCWWKARSKAGSRWASASRCRKRCFSTRRPPDQSQSHQLHRADHARHAGDRRRHRRELRPDRAVRRQGCRRADLVPTAAAILNAIHDAVGVRITSLPATAEKVLAAIKAKRSEERKQLPG